jgi:hypothetical protein
VDEVELLLVDEVELLLVDEVELLLVELLDGGLDVNVLVDALLPLPVTAIPVTVPGVLDDV